VKARARQAYRIVGDVTNEIVGTNQTIKELCTFSPWSSLSHFGVWSGRWESNPHGWSLRRLKTGGLTRCQV
jgi:hypothetical protein